VKIVVLGAGALGSILAAHLARAGQDVSLIARGARAKLLAERGVSLRGLAEFTVEVPIVERPEELDTCDVFVLTAKTYDTAPALEGVRNLKPGMAMSLQNGVVKNDYLADVFGPEHTVGCTANFSGEVLEDGTVLFSRNEGLYFGELPQGTSARTEAFASALNEVGIKAVASDRIRSLEWSKYATWLGMTAAAVLARVPTYILFGDEDLAILQTELTREAVRLAGAAGVEVADLGAMITPRSMAELAMEDSVAALKQAGVAMEAAGATNHRGSALQDLLRGRRLEVEETYGYAVSKAADLGVEIPRLEACYRLLAAINRNLHAAG
jgi:2-dehydropantoate 2-reductase